MNTKKLWIGLAAILVVSFSVLGFYGHEIYSQKPPIPKRVVATDGTVVFTAQDIENGQNVWQSMGGQEIGTVWGHGAYVAPDWSADWLHREATFILNKWAETQFRTDFKHLSTENQAVLKVKLQQILRANTYNENTGVVTVPEIVAQAIQSNSEHYKGLFMNDTSLAKERKDYAIPANTIKDVTRMHEMNAFFYWAAWACVTDRPGKTITYTNNWPPDKTIGNVPTSSLLIWTGFSIIMLLIGIGLVAFYHAWNKPGELDHSLLPKDDPLTGINPTPSMKATLKYFWVVMGMILLQITFGIITAHYGVEGNGFYGIKLSSILPYSVTRTWHLQLGIFWIATSWLATGLYIAPAVSGYEPKYQKLGVNFLFIALIIIVAGSMIGEWMGIMQKMGLTTNFWFGEQGYEYVDLGRFWQIFLFIGLIIWLVLMVRAMLPALKNPTENKNLLTLFLISTIAIAAFYGAGLMWGQHTNLAIAEYWRWWVVHLWVEGFFEVFATVITAFLFVRMGLLNIKYATTGILFATIVYLSGGVLGTFHHLYFSGTPTAVLALGATFSALEVVPLVLMGFEAYHNLSLSRATEWVKKYKWPIYFLVAVSFWNLVGAGIFGFLINPPIALYYMQGLNTTAVHAHTALFGVYGMLGIGLMLFVLKGLTNKFEWKEKFLRIAFWSLNIGILLMALISLLPVGILQAVASIQHGMWYARSAQFMQEPILQTFRWMRVFGDTIFSIGIFCLTWFVIGLKTGWSLNKNR
ncbi:MAG: nitric-oxide reductase large subunit [Bacteroidales bacterium]|nr:nitric-oxide reductase large subunit [Bacteroidales bacterium]